LPAGRPGRCAGRGAVGGHEAEAEFHQQQSDHRVEDPFNDRPDDQGGHDVGGPGRIGQDGHDPVGQQQGQRRERHDPPEMRPDQMRGTAQARRGVPVLDLDDRPDHGQERDGGQPWNDQRHQPHHDDQGGQQVGQDQRAPGQRPQHVADPGVVRAVLGIPVLGIPVLGIPVLGIPVLGIPVLGGTDQPAQEARQEHRAEQAYRRGGQGAEQCCGQGGPVEETISNELGRHGHRGHYDRDGQDPPGVPPAGPHDRDGDRPEPQRRLG
jgi:hypothetical protein